MIENLSPPDAVLSIAAKLERAGFETWCVGGAVRDALLGHAHLDWDLATAARPEQVRKLFPRTVPVGIAFGTVGVVGGDGVMHEVTTFRRDVITDGRHAVVEFGATVEEDLARRDFTINAVAIHPVTREVRDPFRGRDDLANGVIRSVGEAAERMREDRLRALRGIRFAARFGFKVDEGTWRAICDSAPHMGRLSAERVKQEIEKTMEQVRCPSQAFAMWRESGAFDSLIPSLAGATDIGLATVDHIAMPVATGIARAAQAGLPIAKANRRILRLIAMFAASDPGGVARTLQGLRFSNADIAWIGGIISSWASMLPEMRFALADGEPPPDAVLRRWAGLAGRTRLASLLRLAGARWAAERAAGQQAPPATLVHSVYRRAVRIAYRDAVEIGDLAVDGRDMERLGLKGPAVGITLRKLLETVITDPASNSREILLAMAATSAGETRDSKPN